MTTPLNKRSVNSAGFSLVELLTVMTIMAILASLSALTVPGIMSSQTMSKTASDISQTLDDARSYAVANHTYVFVGFEEVDATKLSTATSQSQASASAGGRIAVAVVASQDGTNNYLSSAANYFNAGNLTAISKVKFFNGVHLADLSGLTAGSGPMASRAPVSSANSLGANSTSGGTALFTWPLNSSGSSVQYSFYPNQVIVFDQEGLAGVVNTSSYASGGYAAPTSTWIEIGLQYAHGSIIPVAPTNLAAGQLVSIQLDGVTGANRVLRP